MSEQPLYASSSSMPYPHHGPSGPSGIGSGHGHGLVPGPGAGSKAHSLVGGRGGSEASFLPSYPTRKESASINSFRQQRQPAPSSALGFLPETRGQGHDQGHGHDHNGHMGPGTPTGPLETTDFHRRESDIPPIIRDYATTATPDFTPYLGVSSTPNPNLMFPPRPGPGSTSTFGNNNAPLSLSLSLPNTLQQIQTSLTALHERLATLERTQAMILRRDEKKRGWFWVSKEEEELDQVEDEADRQRFGMGIGMTGGGGAGMGRTPSAGVNTAAAQARMAKRRKGLTARVLWFIMGMIRRAMVDVGIGMFLTFLGFAIFSGGRRVRARLIMIRLRARLTQLLQGL